MVHNEKRVVGCEAVRDDRFLDVFAEVVPHMPAVSDLDRSAGAPAAAPSA